MKNFQFTYKGQNYWYSRANVCVTAVFCKDSKGELNILLNKRGTATNNEQHKWNMPVGYLDYDETLKECAIREIYEETGIKVPKQRMKLFNINDKPEDEKQDIGFRFYCLLFGTIDDYQFSLDNMEENEVEQVQWVNINDLDSVEFAWNHKEIIQNIINNKFSDYIVVEGKLDDLELGKKIFELNLGRFNNYTKLFESTSLSCWYQGEKSYNDIKYSILDNNERTYYKNMEQKYLYEGLTHSVSPEKALNILKRNCEGFIYDLRIVKNPLESDRKTPIIDFFIPVQYLEDPDYGEIAFNEVKKLIFNLGYFISGKKRNKNVIDFIIMPKYLIEVTEQIYDSYNNDGILFHITPLSNKKKIINKGLIPRRNSKRLDEYPERIYFYIKRQENSLEALCKDLSRDTGITDWLILKIDLKDRRSYIEGDLSTMYKFFDDPKSQNGVFTYENIDPLCISIYKKINL